MVVTNCIVADGTQLLVENSAVVIETSSLFGAALVVSFSAKATQLECERCHMYVGKCSSCEKFLLYKLIWT